MTNLASPSRALLGLLVVVSLAALVAPAVAQTPPPGQPKPLPLDEVRKRRPTRSGVPPVTPPPAAAPVAPGPTVVPPAGAPAPPAAPGAPPPVAPPPVAPPPGTPPTPAATPPVVAPGAGPAGEAPGEDAELYRCRRFKPNERIKVTLKPDTGFTDLVAWVMGFTCKSFIYGNAISGRASKVTIIAPSEMSPADAYRLFLVALQTMNLTIVPKGNSLEIVESQRGREMPLPVYRGAGTAPTTDQVVRVIMRPEHVSPDELSQVLNAMKTGTGVVAPIPSAGVVIVTDYGSTIDKMMDVLKDVDAQTSAEKIYIIYLNNADAAEMAQKLSEIFGIGKTGSPSPAPNRAPQPMPGGVPAAPVPGGSSGGSRESAVPSKIIPDARTNSLIVISSERAYQRILALVRRLDPPIPEGETGQIHVYALSNADAEALAATMNSLITGQNVRPSQPGRPGAPPVAQPAPGAVGQQGASGAFEGQIKLTHDKPTNSLVIVSSGKDYYSLREVIKKLDQPRRQVFVEATILEVSLDRTRKVGFSYHGGAQFDLKTANDTTAYGGVESKSLSSLATNPATLDGLIGGAIGPLIPGLSIPSIGVIFQLVQSSNEVNVLSSPNILTTDNEPAEISVGQNIPYLSTSLSGLSQLGGGAAGGTTGTPAANPLLGLGGFGQSVQRQDVALTLKLTPHVNESDSVRLEVDLEISDILTENFGGNGPSWSKRKVKTPIVVKDQQPVVIGGLMSDKVTLTETKVPLLGDIPLLGYLFKYQSKQKVKTNLLVFLTPYIIKDQSDIQRIFEQKVRERRDFVDAYSAFEDRTFEQHVDYRRKRGLVAEIARAVGIADEDDRLMEEGRKRRKKRGEEGEVELPVETPASPTTTAPEPIAPPAPMPEPQPPPSMPEAPPGE